MKSNARLKVPPVWSSLPPKALFADITYLGHGEEALAWKQEIEAHCIACGEFAQIDYHPDYGWVFHSLDRISCVDRKAIADLVLKASSPPPPREPAPYEMTYEDEIASALVDLERTVTRQYTCTMGTADIVTENAVFEVKRKLSRRILREAIGQVLLYRQAINPSLNACVIGPKPDNFDRLQDVVKLAEGFGVKILFWPDDDLESQL